MHKPESSCCPLLSVAAKLAPDTAECCAGAKSIKELCPACRAQWERWINEIAVPVLRRAIAEEVPNAA